MTTPYKPVSFSSELISQDKLQQVANNTQWLFDNTARIRYKVNELTKDNGLKILVGKASHPIVTTANWIHGQVQFGNFFSQNCKPIVTIGIEGQHGGNHRNQIVIYPLVGTEIDHTGFGWVVSTYAYNTLMGSGFCHYMAVGY